MSREDLFRWKSKRNTGLKVTWYYDTESSPEYKYRAKNTHFTRLANIIHNNSDYRKRIWSEIGWARYNYFSNLTGEENCIGENMANYQQKIKLIQRIFSFFPETSNEPIFEKEISSETLETAQKMFYSLTRCPHHYEAARELTLFFYRLNKFSFKTIFVTLVRMIVTSKKNNKISEMFAARGLLRQDFIKNIFN